MSAARVGRAPAASLAPIARLEAQLFRYRVETPVRTSFGVMTSRPALFVRIEDREGGVGWGEVWCNFPDCGAEHRAHLLRTLFAPLLEGHGPAEPAAVSADLTERTAVLAIQSGEPGPIQQCIAGIDTALWDLAARRAGEPLWRYLGGASPHVHVYASGINPEAPESTAARCREEGHRAFKLKVGFGEARDLANLRAMRAALGDAAMLMADANQAWPLDAALAIVPRLERFGLAWLEEPLRADRPPEEWLRLARATRISLAGGENFSGHEAFEDALRTKALAVVQPDVAKWGGISGCLAVARRVREAESLYCPHYLGGGVGLLASAHLLAAVGGDGLLEIDANPNPLRSAACGPVARVREGRIVLDERPGLGAEPDAAALREFRVAP